MRKLLSVLFGAGLLLLGSLALVGNILFATIGIRIAWWEIWLLWPLLVLGIGVFLTSMGFLALKERSFGTLFIAGIPILSTGAILLMASLTGWWGIWALTWPLVVIGLAAGFVLAALFTRLVWFGIPAIIIGLNGIALAFCALSGLWSAWAVLWTIEPLAVGLVLLLIAAQVRSTTLAIIGLAGCAFAGLALVLVTALIPFSSLFFRLIGPASLILLGVIVLVWAVRPHRSTPIEIQPQP